MTTNRRIPAHLPRRLAISLWDFSWYAMTTPGEPFDDLDRAFAEAVERGYNTVRVCAMPLFLFAPDGPRPGPLRLSNLGGDFGQRTRWYNARGGAVLDGHAHLLRLFRAAKAHDCFVIVSSWEYQQSPAFLATRELWDELLAIPPERRFMTLARALGQLVQFLKDHDLADRIAYVELHNEVEAPRLAEVSGERAYPPRADTYAAEKPYLEEGVAALRARHPDILVTVSYAAMGGVDTMAQNLQVAHHHLYAGPVLGALYEAIGHPRRGYADEPEWPPDLFTNDVARAILRPDAPPFAAWWPDEMWRLDATDKWDLWLYLHCGDHQEATYAAIDRRASAIAQWAGQQGIPAVAGEGYVGYTPLLAGFEEGPVGKAIAEHAIEACLQLDFWGMVLCSNAAPHHPFWRDVAWQRRWNRRIRAEP